MPVNNLIQLRKGTETEWNLANPVLASGEAGYDLTNKVLKIGDGVTAWNNLNNHKHNSSNIDDFNSSVSGLLPVINGSGYINSSFSNNIYTISVSGLQPSGNYSPLFDQNLNTTNDVSFNDLTIVNPNDPSKFTNVSIDGMAFIDPSETSGVLSVSAIGILFQDSSLQTTAWTGVINSNQVSNFNSSVSGLLPSVSGSGYAVSSFANNIYTISVSGLQPSGNYSLVGHSHNSSDITNFNSSVSGLLPVTNITGGNNITVSQSGTVFNVAVTGSLGLTTEEVDDRVSNLLVAGSGISLDYDDNSNSLTVAVSGLSNTINIGNGSGNVITFNTSETLNVVGSGSTTVSYNDSTNTINISGPSLIREYELVSSTKSTFSVTGGYALNNLDVYHNGIKLLASGDYSATNGTSFTLVQPAVSGDVVEWLGYSIVPRSQLILGEVRSDTVGNINYLGRAVAGSSEASNVWTIKRYSIANNGIDITTATASNAIWNNRLTETYL